MSMESPKTERGRSSQIKISSRAQVPSSTVICETDFIENEHSKIQSFCVASGQLLKCLNLEWKLSEIYRQNELNSSF